MGKKVWYCSNIRLFSSLQQQSVLKSGEFFGLVPMFKNDWSCSNVRSFFQPLVEKCLCEKWSFSNVQKSLVGLVPMFDPFSSRLIAISSVFSPFVPHFSERHARPIEKTNKPKIFEHFAKDFLSKPRTASSKSLSEKSFSSNLVYLVCEVRMM